MSADRYLSFRLRGIPCVYQSRVEVRELVKKILCIEPGASVVVRSLAISPIDGNSQVATLSFHTIPDSLSGYSRNEWAFELPASDSSNEDAFDVGLLVFDTHFSGFTPLHHAKDSDCHIDIIAISGLGGHAFGSFKQRQGSFMWLRDALPLDVPNARILIYGYDTRLIQSSSFQNLTDLGRALQDDLKGIRESGDFRPVIFIGHSLGGLIVKEVGTTIVQLKEEPYEEDTSILKSIAAFLFFGVPHQGMATESLVPLVQNAPNRSLLESLNKNSALLERLASDFSKSFNGDIPRVISFYETEKSRTAVKVRFEKPGIRGIIMPLTSFLVEISSATYRSNNQHPVNRNHSELVKYSNQYDGIYERVRTVLRPLVNRLSRRSVVGSMEVERSPTAQLSNANFECLRSLSFREQEHRYNDIISAKNSCEWLLEDSQYQAWMDSPGGLFWIKGNPGAGKSVLMKFAVTTMKKRVSKERVLSFFVHGRGVELQNTPLGVFRALLHSMLELFPDYLSGLTSRFNSLEKRFGSYQEKRWQWHELELKKLMSEILTKGTKKQPIIIFVDALDECGKDHAKSLLSYFKDLMKDVEHEGAQLKICFSSRHYPILGLDMIPSISVEERNDKDIRLFVRGRLEDIQPVAKRQKLETEILQKAHGGFQWTVLIVDILMDGFLTGVNTDNLYNQLETTPEALGELYGNLLGGVVGAEKGQMVKLFLWVLFAKRPLSVQELREALTTDKNMTYTSVSQLRRHASNADTSAEFERRIRHISRGLVEFQTREIVEQYEAGGEESDREAQFIHQSVADYILEEFLNQVGFGSNFNSTVGAGHFQISRSCLRYLALREVLEETQLTRGPLSLRFPLLPYVVRYLFHHIRKVEQEGIPQLDLLQVIQKDWHPKVLRRITSVWRVMNPHNAYTPMGWPFAKATPLHFLIALGSKSAFDAFLQVGDVQVGGRDSDGNTPLLLAIRERHQEIALELLNRSIEWQNRHKVAVQISNDQEETTSDASHSVNVNAENNDGETSLTLALAEGLGEVIFKLIEAGADLKSFGQQTALVIHAIAQRHELLFAQLLKQKVKLDGAVYFALKELTNAGDDDILEDFIVKLLNAGANTSKNLEVTNRGENDNDDDDEDEEDEEEDEAILLASRTGQRSIVSLLLSHGASTTVGDKNRSTPLSLASQNGHEAVVKTLIDSGADVKASDKDGWTPLLLASQNGHEAVVNTLIDRGADIDASNSNGSTSLLLASENGHEAVVEILIENRADVKASYKDGWTPLLLASQNGHEAVVKTLIDSGADVKASNSYGSTSLLLASENGHEAVVEILIENRADVNSVSINQVTWLGWL
ncbi:hypothetical protein HZ326_25897 [Fusarium oxysporum f. sp. albedinis]|nr:hypothetical protein HZ326_25897 [Fusarium oxysporum f. sp. albedinis]